MLIIEFIREHDDWRDLLAQPPYCVTIKDDGVYTLLVYSQYDSDFNVPIVRECRGVIFRNDQDFRPVCVPFFKFGNYGEGYCPNIDWESAKVQEKVDGSIIKCWYDDGWHVSTKGMIDARRAHLNDDTDRSYQELFDEAAEKSGLSFNVLDRDCTYMFELIGPDNRVIVPYTEAKLIHIGTRNNKTLQELDVDIGIDKPKQYPFRTADECLAAAKALPFNEEGYVVVDRFWNRVKIKSPAYVAAHHLRNNGVVTVARIVNFLLTGEAAEFLTYFPEYTEDVEQVQLTIRMIVHELESRVDELSQQTFENQKEFALFVKDDPFSAFFFEWRKNQTPPEAWIKKSPARLAEYVQRPIGQNTEPDA